MTYKADSNIVAVQDKRAIATIFPPLSSFSTILDPWKKTCLHLVGFPQSRVVLVALVALGAEWDITG